MDDRQEFDFGALRLDWLRLQVDVQFFILPDATWFESVVLNFAGCVPRQAYTSVNKAPLPLREYTDLAKVMNLVQFHTRMVDSVDELLHETSEVSVLWLVCSRLSVAVHLLSSAQLMTHWLCYSYFPRTFEKMFTLSCEEINMKRYLMAFPSVCSHFSQCGHPLCPEEVSVW